ncbi:DUF1538 domain-containing protein [Desulfocurvibacter africanus]|uniref:DUF1538 domain-containing protein n=1 Tax=Desulfocurvibacter africanus TaxID=873 RepID=UPI002FD92A3A
MSYALAWIDVRAVLLENLWGLAAIAFFTMLLNVFFLRLERQLLFRLAKGGLMVLAGLVLFLQGVNVGLVPAGTALAESLGNREGLRWLLVPLTFALGFAVTRAEPAVRILCSQVERTTSGSISEKLLLPVISLGVAFFAALGMARILLGFPLQYVLLPGYGLALALMPFCRPLFIGIAFDAATVTTGPMVITFVMALAIGLAEVMEHRDPLLDGFGMVALVALAPVLAVMVVGVMYTAKTKGRDE